MGLISRVSSRTYRVAIMFHRTFRAGNYSRRAPSMSSMQFKQLPSMKIPIQSIIKIQNNKIPLTPIATTIISNLAQEVQQLLLDLEASEIEVSAENKQCCRQFFKINQSRNII